MSLGLQKNTNEATGALLPIDEAFAAFNPATHLTEDLYANKIAFIIALNFPEIPLSEKENLGETALHGHTPALATVLLRVFLRKSLKKFRKQTATPTFISPITISMQAICSIKQVNVFFRKI